MDLGVRDQGYLVVGGTAGMGFQAARSLAADGARVAVCGRNEDRARRAADAIAAEHAVQVVPIVGDVSKGAEEAERVVAEATAALGDLAGMAVTTGLVGHVTLEDATDAIWEEAVQDVLMSVVRTVKAVVPQLAARGSGTIVTTSAYSIHAPHANRMAYVALKGAVAVFTKNVAKSYGRAGVRANCVCPGAIETDGPGGGAHADRQGARRARGRRARAGHGRRMAHGRRARSARAPRRGRGAVRVPALAARRLSHGRHDQHRRRHRLLRRTLSRPEPGWRNGRRRRLKPAGSSGSVRVRIPPRARL